MEAAREAGVDINLRVHVYGFDGIRRMVEAGLGIAILPQGAVLPYLSSRSITAMTLDEPWADRTLYVGTVNIAACRWWHGIWWKCSTARLRASGRSLSGQPSHPTRPPSPINGRLRQGLRRWYHAPINGRTSEPLCKTPRTPGPATPDQGRVDRCRKVRCDVPFIRFRTRRAYILWVSPIYRHLGRWRTCSGLRAEERYGAASLDDAIQNGTTLVSEDSEALVKHAGIDVIVSARVIPSPPSNTAWRLSRPATPSST